MSARIGPIVGKSSKSAMRPSRKANSPIGPPTIAPMTRFPIVTMTATIEPTMNSALKTPKSPEGDRRLDVDRHGSGMD